MSVQRLLVSLAVLVLTSQPSSAVESLTPDQTNFFETKIRPVLVKECYGCHSEKAGNVRGGLRLDTKQFSLLGGSSGPAVVPFEPDDSLLISAIHHDDFVMPPKKKLTADQITDFEQWIKMGAPDPRESEIETFKSSITADEIATAKQEFWAYRLPQQISPPHVADVAWPKTDIDRFIAAGLEAKGLPLSVDATSSQVLRRLCFDLTGLPPTPKQIEAFTSGWNLDADAAIAATVEELLSSNAFGERWGRHWLDVARYGESTGGQVNMTFPHAWRYRDYVIDSFNDDKPFDQFAAEQIAGDLMPAKTDRQWTEQLIATTFLAIGAKNLNEQNRIQFAADLIDEQIDATTRVFLGTSVACARCHDHKFDPIPQTDYYAMAGVFRNATTYFGNPPSEFGNFSPVQANRTSSLIVLPVEDPNPYDKRYSRSELADLRAQMNDKFDQQRSMRSQSGQSQAARLRLNNEIAELSAKLAVVDDQGQPRSYCMGVQEQASAQNATLLVRGEIDLPAQEIPRGIPSVLVEQPISIADDSSGRLELARWIGSDENSLTARVMVNRVWQHMIGRGLVTSTENFGSTGTAPSHPELLDHMAVEFAQSGWSVKTLIRQIATSRVYRIASTYNETSFERDPDNTLLWRANVRRLDAEAIRDAMLSASANIDLDRPRGSEVAKAGYLRVRGGFLGDPREAVQKMMLASRDSMRNNARRRFGFGFQNGRDSTADMYQRITRSLDMNDAMFRSVYLPVVRDELPRALDVFDFADPSAVIGTREESNTANQSLFMMNNPLVIAQSDAMATRIAKSYQRPAAQVHAAFVLSLGRRPTGTELAATMKYLGSLSDGGSRQVQPLAAVCQSLFACAEFRYLD
ncbi:Planctomycete cytochrome C [Rubripirellula tenax]|uniref:Planctomycete cytochrome C n=1 Tax=Rubripirellula tenax TaxID=2528015 RepID=A0A5C6F0W5_9BACT|nr:PSD1 and planctomycete cytochrome C domain-containing protein [Rubripirellula tenax]TWU54675.1 Planctomycete cytochrome C [Rubripirellula tenax]